MRGFFDFIAPVYEKIRPRSQSVFTKLNSLVEFNSSDIVLDIGGGAGSIAKYFVGKIKSIVVIDPSPKMIEQCQKHPDLSCMVACAENLPLADNSVGKIILVDAFHHISQQIAAIAEMQRVLKVGGTIIIAEYNPLTFGGRCIEILEKILRLGSTFHSPDSLRKLFTDRGFRARVVDEKQKEYFLIATM